MSQYEVVVDAKGVTRYKLDGKFVKAAEVPEDVKADLADAAAVAEVVEETAPAVEEVADPGASSDDVDDESGLDEELTPVKEPVGEVGMGFKRVNGKTVDIFDGKTPHTAVRFVQNIMVPLTIENYNTKSDTEIVERLKKLKKL